MSNARAQEQGIRKISMEKGVKGVNKEDTGELADWDGPPNLQALT